MASALGNDEEAAGELQNLGAIETRSGNLNVAAEHFDRALDIGLARNDTYLLPYVFLGFAAVAAKEGDVERSAQLVGVIDAMLASA